MFDWDVLAKLGGALVLSIPMAWDREKAQRAAGLRTFSLVSVTACGFLLVGFEFLDEQIGNARLMQGLIGGLGFLGGGAILKSNGSIHGMATAASIWSAGAIGMAAAYGQWDVGIVVSLLNFLALTLGGELKEAVGHDGEDQDDRPGYD
ncbi:MAG: MgtC/SapB family protein [Verrucomicrobiales bacterium]